MSLKRNVASFDGSPLLKELSNPVSFALENSWTTTLKSDKLHFLFLPEPVAFRRVYGTWDLLVYHVTICEKAPCTDLRSDPTLHQNFYRTTQADAYVNHAHQTQAQRV